MKLTNEEGRKLLNKQAKKKPVTKWQLPKLTESQQQSESVDWFREQYPQYILLFYAVPNGGYRSKRTSATMQREGQLSGVPDLVLAVPKNGFHGLYIEQKIKGNKPTENQLNVMAALTSQGYCCKVVYSLDEFKKTIESYLTAL